MENIKILFFGNEIFFVIVEGNGISLEVILVEK